MYIKYEDLFNNDKLEKIHNRFVRVHSVEIGKYNKYNSGPMTGEDLRFSNQLADGGVVFVEQAKRAFQEEAAYKGIPLEELRWNEYDFDRAVSGYATAQYSKQYVEKSLLVAAKELGFEYSKNEIRYGVGVGQKILDALKAYREVEYAGTLRKIEELKERLENTDDPGIRKSLKKRISELNNKINASISASIFGSL